MRSAHPELNANSGPWAEAPPGMDATDGIMNAPTARHPGEVPFSASCTGMRVSPCGLPTQRSDQQTVNSHLSYPRCRTAHADTRSEMLRSIVIVAIY